MSSQTNTVSIQERNRKNPTGWILLLGIGLLFFFLLVWPRFNTWLEKRSFYIENKPLVEAKKEQNKADEEKIKELEKEVVELWNIVEKEEKQQFPTEIDPHKIAQILEVYALQLKNLISDGSQPYFELNQLNFGRTQTLTSPDNEKETYSTTELTIQLETDRENFTDFVHYLQTGRLSPRFHQIAQEKENSLIKTEIYEFLKTNLLPLAHIESIRYEVLEEDVSSEEDIQVQTSANERMRVNINAQLFSQSPSQK